MRNRIFRQDLPPSSHIRLAGHQENPKIFFRRKVFDLLGLSPSEARHKFSFLLDALERGAPPHGGIAFGLDRIVMLLTGTDNIRDVIAFPKTQNGADLMTEAPNTVDERQLRELHVANVGLEPTTSP